MIRLLSRYSVIGTSGSGKTFVASEIARRLSIKHIELDALHWRNGWKETPLNKFKHLVDEATREDTWVVDGNYSHVRDLVWRKATVVVWLDLPFKTVFWRTLSRTILRILTREELWNGNVEGLDALIGLDSMPLWVIKTYWRRKKEYPELFSKSEYSHLQVIRLMSRRKVRNWLTSLVKN
jgi:adenylate kinase family enzyme